MSAKPTLVQLILNATTAGKAMLTAANAAAQKALLSLENVDNTSDENKPVSTLQQAAIDAKIGGTVGTTADRLVKSSGTGGSTVQSTGIGVDASNNLSGVGTIVCGTLTTTGDLITPGVSGFANSGIKCGGISIGRGASGTVAGEQINMYSNFVRKTSIVSSAFNVSSDFAINVKNNVNNNAGTNDCSLIRSATSQWATLSDSGLAIRSFANSADAPLTAGAITASGLLCCGVYTFATVPSASSNTGKFLRISDRAQKHAYSDGTNWRFFGDDTVIS